MIDQDTYDLLIKVPPWASQFFEQNAGDYIDRMVQDCRQEHRWVTPQSSKAVLVMTPSTQGTPHIFSVTKAANPSPPIKETGEKHPDSSWKWATIQVNDASVYMYLSEPAGRTMSGPDRGDPCSGESSSSKEERQRKRQV